jgi:hypothetical protein
MIDINIMSINKNKMFNVLRSQTIISMIQNQIGFQKTKNGILIIHKSKGQIVGIIIGGEIILSMKIFH